nr:receptor kinase-like protein Xa21 isoform X1 [Coffea arabica]
MPRLLISIPATRRVPLALLTVVALYFTSIPLDTASTKTMKGQKEADDRDVVALLAFKSIIQHDPYGIMNSWNDSHDLCRWEGIQCGRKHKRVTSINLKDKGLVGFLSPFLGNLSFLRALNLTNNTFQGEIPAQFGQLFRLQILSLSWNSIEGEIPANLSRCSSLVQLSLSYNKLVGRLPPAFGFLRNLETLAILTNDLTGAIPSSLGNLTSLTSLAVVDNHLVGNIPETLGQLRNLRVFGFGGNELYGTIPPSIYNLSQLKTLSVPANQLHGSLPSALGLMLPHLRYLLLADNQFTGMLPVSITNASDLTTIDIGHNRFKGKIAVDFGGLPNLVVLFAPGNNFGSGELDEMHFLSTMTNCSNLVGVDLGSNQLKGVLPSNIGNLSQFFRMLSLGDNHIYGGIPSVLGNLVSLDNLILEGNQLTGSIPSTIGNLQKLQMLALDSNKLSGKIPDSLGNLSLMNKLYLGGNMLDGTIPPSLGNCQGLLFLELSQNNLSGFIPKEIFGISSLSIYLGLSNNHLSGTLPLEVGNLENLAEFDASENQLSGELPETLGSCSSLESLSLAGNLFEGSIPKFLSSMRAIQILDLSRNNFSGQIPHFLEELAIKTLNLSYNDFVGKVPKKGVFANASAISVVGNRRLCGGIFQLQLPKCRILRDSKKHKKPLRVIIPIIIPTSIVFLGVILISIFRQRSLKKRSYETCLSGGLFLKLNYKQLLQATNGFSAENLVGVGSFGSVYKGNLNEERNLTVAVKVFNLLHHGAFKSFCAECEVLRNIRHRNLVKIITSCSSLDVQGNEFKALVYEFMPNGSLDNWLHSWEEDQQNKSGRPNLLQRINVAIDVACALDYLHHHCHAEIVHCDLKPSNILLDNDLTAHVGDFGLAKFLQSPLNLQESSSAGIRGTIGYVAPEYGLGAEVSTYGDVYSFGILLLEMVTGKRPTHALFSEGLDLHKFVEMAVPDRVMDIVDPVLLIFAGDSSKCSQLEDCLISLLKVGLACSTDLPQDRMNMAEVFSSLKSIKDTFSMAGL